ncbi:MAG: HAMP domain-containing histidine kinase [Ruminococcaceae bacterium]|nr:HAMP domain-containing histidine kinase [Oscillospiraceae bacterium]
MMSIFAPYESAAFPCYFLQADGTLVMNTAAATAGPPLSDEKLITQLLTTALQARHAQKNQLTVQPLLSDALTLRTLTLVPLEDGLLAMAAEPAESPTPAFSSQMREPLTNIFATLPLITKRLDDPDLRYTEEIQENCYQLLRLANNLENAVRIEKRQYEPRSVDLVALVQSLCYCADSICHGTPITWSLPDHVLPVRADAQLLSEMFLNILRNSLQYTRDGNHIAISLKEVGGKAVLTIEDHGLGILPENLEQVFEPYFSVDPYGDSHIHPGLGLGLAVVRQTAARFGGQVTIESRFGEGTKVFVALPLDKKPDDVLGSDSATYLLNRYSAVYIQLCGYCRLPGL